MSWAGRPSTVERAVGWVCVAVVAIGVAWIVFVSPPVPRSGVTCVDHGAFLECEREP